MAFDTNTVIGPLNLDKWEKATSEGPYHVELPGKQNKVAFTIDNVLTKSESQMIINKAENSGFHIAGLGTHKKQVQATALRDSFRLMTDDEQTASIFFERIEPYLPRVWKGRKISHLNKRLRILKYNPGQKFITHVDGIINLGNCQSVFTFHLYLTTVPKGGATSFIAPIPNVLDFKNIAEVEAAANSDNDVHCHAVQGRVLVFEQSGLFHCGQEVEEGTKYTIRTDIMYEREMSWEALCTECLGYGGAPKDDWKMNAAYGFFGLMFGAATAYKYIKSQAK